ncbi:MAG TPA: ATPase [Bacteroidetes bacterium]|nr:ATPase [Bacteroidota bacterium]
MKRIIAVPTQRKCLCAHFGHCEEFALYETDNGEIRTEKFIEPPPHEPGVYPAWLASMGVTHVIAGGMGQRAVSLFRNSGIEPLVGAPARPPRELVIDFLQNRLETGMNACDH